MTIGGVVWGPTRPLRRLLGGLFFFFGVLDLTVENNPRYLGGKKSFGQAHPPSVSRRRKRPNATGRSYQGHAAHCPSLPDSPRGRSALRLLRASRRRLIGLTLVFASSNCSAGEPDRPIQGQVLTEVICAMIPQSFRSRALSRAPRTGVCGLGDHLTRDLSRRESAGRSAPEKSN